MFIVYCLVYYDTDDTDTDYSPMYDVCTINTTITITITI